MAKRGFTGGGCRLFFSGGPLAGAGIVLATLADFRRQQCSGLDGLVVNGAAGAKVHVTSRCFFGLRQFMQQTQPRGKRKTGAQCLAGVCQWRFGDVAGLIESGVACGVGARFFYADFCRGQCRYHEQRNWKYYRGQTYDILRWQKITPGLSGGVSVVGTLAGLPGSAIMVLLAGLIFPFSWFEQSVLMLGGFGGMLLDSILGSVLQAKYR
jgi:hypothetical protein